MKKNSIFKEIFNESSIFTGLHMLGPQVLVIPAIRDLQELVSVYQESSGGAQNQK